MRRLAGWFLVLVTGCGGAASQPATAPHRPHPPAEASKPAAAAGKDAFALPDGPRDEGSEAPSPAPVSFDAWQTARKAKGVPAPPALCAPFGSRAPAAGKPDKPDLVAALAEKDAARRDAMLAAIEASPGVSPAAIRAQRAELAPVECADAIVDPLLVTLAQASAGDGDLVRVAIGLSLAGKLARLGHAPPSMAAARDKEKVKAFIKGPLRAWVVEQAQAIETLSSGAAGLSGYARGVAAIEAGVADLRLVDAIRSAPVPATWDAELKAVYEAALDEALEPRKTRGRDAALVGMADLARAGVYRDGRLDRARALLAKLYGGRRIDALDGLLLATAPAVPPPASVEDAARATIPVFYVRPDDLGWGASPQVLSRGVTRSVREAMRNPAAAPDDLRSRYARARLDMGRVHWRRVDFVEAAHAAAAGTRPEDRLVLAVALALAKGPNGAAEMMRAATPAALGLSHTDALDALAAERGTVAAIAAYDAAHLRLLSPPDGDAAGPYLEDVAARFRNAATMLIDPAQKKVAEARAADVDAIRAARTH